MALPLSSIPKPITRYTTALSAKITSTATSLTVETATDDAGNAISGVVGVTIDNEDLIGTKSGTTISGLLRGIDPQDGTTEVTSLKAAHQRGAVVKITTSPFLTIAYRLLNGDEGFPNKVKYASAPTFSADEELVSKKYADDLVIAGAPDATSSTKGIFEKGTAAEAVSGAADGSGDTTAPLALTTSIASSTGGASKVVVSAADGLIDDSLLALTAAGDIVYSDGTDLVKLALGTANQRLSVNAGATAPEWQTVTTDNDVDVQEFTSGGTWTKPANAQYVEAIVVGAGGGGGSGQYSTGGVGASGGCGGGGGAVALASFKASMLGATETITVGSGGTGGAARTSNNNGANGGNGGISSLGSFLKAGGGGGGYGGNTTATGGAGGSYSSAALSTGGSPVATAGTDAFATQASAPTDTAGVNSEWGGASGSAYKTTDATDGGSSIYAGAGGGAGGSIVGGPIQRTAADGGTTNSYTLGGGGAKGGDSAAGSNGTDIAYAGQGGGGGGSTLATTAGDGGDGGVGCGGGGGGSRGTTGGTTSGAGGDGGDGYVLVITHLST